MTNPTHNSLLLPVIFTAVVFAGAGFFAGTKYQLSRTSQNMFANRATGGNRLPNGSRFNGQMGARGIFGEILKVDDNSLTLKLPDNSSKIIMLSSTTTLGKETTATKSDLTVGQTVRVFGTDNTDGSLTGTSIQLNPPALPSRPPQANQ